MDKWTSGAKYERWMGRWSRLVADEFVQWLATPARLAWLDVCCGSGVLSEAILERAAAAKVCGIDASPAQIEFAQKHRGSGKAAFQAGDAGSLPFEDASFDVAVSGLGLNYLPEPQRALREMRRVVRRGGTIAGYVWDYREGARFLREFWDAAIAVDPEAPAIDQAQRFPFCTPDGLRELFESAELKPVATTALAITTRFTSFDDYWEPLLSEQGSAPNYVASRSPEVRSAIRERLRTSLPQGQGGEIVLPARAWAVRGTN